MKDVSLIVYPVENVDEAKRFFRELIGADPYAESPYYVGFKSGETEIGLTPSGGDGSSGALAYWTVDDIATRVQQLVDAGGTVAQPVTDVSQGLLVASIKGPSGAIVGLRQFPK